MLDDSDELLVIAPSGDLILDVSQEEGSQVYFYRVDSKTLQQKNISHLSNTHTN